MKKRLDVLAFRAPADVHHAIGRLAKQEAESRGVILRRLIRDALKQRGLLK